MLTSTLKEDPHAGASPSVLRKADPANGRDERPPLSITEEIEQLWVFPVFIASVAALALSYEEVTRTVLYLTEKGGAREGNRGLLKLSAIMVRTKEEQGLPPAALASA